MITWLFYCSWCFTHFLSFDLSSEKLCVDTFKWCFLWFVGFVMIGMVDFWVLYTESVFLSFWNLWGNIMQKNADLGLFVSQFLLRKHNNLFAKIEIKTSWAISNFPRGNANFSKRGEFCWANLMIELGKNDLYESCSPIY